MRVAKTQSWARRTRLEANMTSCAARDSEPVKGKRTKSRSKKAGKPLRRLIKWSKSQGDISLNGELYEEAVTHYSTAINAGGQYLSDSKLAVLYANRSSAYLQGGHLKEALEDAEKSVSLKPKWPRAWSRKSEALDRLGETKRAQAASRQAAFWEESLMGLSGQQYQLTKPGPVVSQETAQRGRPEFSWMSSWRSLIDDQLNSIAASVSPNSENHDGEHEVKKVMSQERENGGPDADESILELDKRLQEAIDTAQINSSSSVDVPPPTPSTPDTPKRIWDFAQGSSSPAGLKRNPDSLFQEKDAVSPLNGPKKAFQIAASNRRATSSLGIVPERRRPKNVRFPENEVQSVWIMRFDSSSVFIHH
eukprot:768375-Hanusia_phi.AAC.7